MEEQTLVSLLKARIVELEARAAEWHLIVLELTAGILELEKRMQAQIAELQRQRDAQTAEKITLSDQWM